MRILKPGMSFREVSEKSWPIPDEFLSNRYSSMIHGVGLADEYPASLYVEDYLKGSGYDGILEPGMTICIESYIGEVGGDEGVKLEEQVLITDTGVEVLSKYPFEKALL